MSRGPGRWQRLLLAALDKYDVVPVRDLVADAVGRPPTRAELVAARRAAHLLADTDQVREIYPGYCWYCEMTLREFGHPHRCGRYSGQTLAVTRDPMVMSNALRGTPAWSRIPPRLSVACARSTDEGNTYGGAS